MLRADLSLEKDMGGPRHCMDRVEITANLLGKEGKTNRAVNFEERKLETSKKARALKDDEEALLRPEASRGFEGKLSVDDFQDQSHLALPASALSSNNTPSKCARDILIGLPGLAPSPVKGASAGEVVQDRSPAEKSDVGKGNDVKRIRRVTMRDV